MKKILAAAITFLFLSSLITGCGAASTMETENASQSAGSTAATETASGDTAAAETAGETKAGTVSAYKETPVRIAALKGPTAMGMVHLMNEAEGGSVNGNLYEFTLAASADEVTPKLVQGELDIAAVPANLASVLYNNTQGNVQVLAVNTLGVLYIVENGDTIKSAADLAGKTIYASGKGSTPEYALNYILSANGIDPTEDVTIEWKSEHSECVAAISTEEGGIAMIPQPFMTTAQMKNENLHTVLDLTAEWNRLQENSESPGTMITGVVVVRSDFAAKNPEAIHSFLDSYKKSVAFVNGSTEEAAALVEKYDIVPASVAVKALPHCNITFIEGTEMKEKLSGYLNVLFEQNPKAVGGALPDDGFYYCR